MRSNVVASKPEYALITSSWLRLEVGPLFISELLFLTISPTKELTMDAANEVEGSSFVSLFFVVYLQLNN